MDLRRVRTWDWLTGLAGVALLVSLFLPWYSAGDQSGTAWEWFSVIDVILFVTALAGIAVPIVTAMQRTAAVPQAVTSTLIWLFLVAAVIAVIRLLNVPDVHAQVEGAYLNTSTGYTSYAGIVPLVGRDAGVWIGTIAALALVAFDIKAMRDKTFPASMRPRLHIETIAAPTADGTRRDMQ
jgi:hypothetical protein